MQVDNQQRLGILAASTIVGTGAGVVAGNYMPLVNAKSEANSDRFVKEVAKEMTTNKLYSLVSAANAKDHLDTLYPQQKGFNPNGEQIEKFFKRFGEFLGLKREEVLTEDGKPQKGVKAKLFKAVEGKISDNGEVSFSENGREFKVNAQTSDAEAKSLIKDGFKKKKLVEKAGENITEEGLGALKRAMKTIKNERMIKGGILGAAAALATAAIATCQKDN